jgi:hypothetical protein
LQKLVWCSFHFYFPVFFNTILFQFHLFADISTGKITTLAGSSHGFKDAIGSGAKMDCPFGMCLNPLDNCLYVADSQNHKIRKVTMNGTALITAHFDLIPFVHHKYRRCDIS